MARRSRGRNADTTDIANSTQVDLFTELLRPVEPSYPEVSRIDEFLGSEVPYDGRAFSFGELEPFSLTEVHPPSPSSTAGSVAPARRSLSTSTMAFRQPETVAVCHRRQTRREVLFAKGRTNGRRRRRRSWSSSYKC